MLQDLDASPHQFLGLLLAARAGGLRDEPLRFIESLRQRRRHVLAGAKRLREGYLNGAPATTRPYTGRSRRIHQRSPIDAHTAGALIVREPIWSSS